MMGLITVRERGSTPRRMKKEMRQHQKSAWHDAGTFYHKELTPKRFTVEHARRARYAKRRGEGLPKGSKAYRRSYHGRKEASEFGGGVGHALPLVYTGDSQRASRTVRIAATSNLLRLKYRLNVFNFRTPGSRVHKNKEFRIVLKSEVKPIAGAYDTSLDKRLKRDATTTTETI